MMTTTSDRLKLPFLAVAQAQKEMTHNEALALLDVAVQPVVQEVAPIGVPAAPALGQCWIVGQNPTGEWIGQAGSLAAWTTGGWRFVLPFEGMTAWSIGDGLTARRAGSAWIVGRVTAAAFMVGNQQVIGARRPAISASTGGTTVDLQARTAIAAILDAMTAHGLIS
jgi:hypothetical protein